MEGGKEEDQRESGDRKISQDQQMKEKCGKKWLIVHWTPTDIARRDDDDDDKLSIH